MKEETISKLLKNISAERLIDELYQRGVMVDMRMDVEIERLQAAAQGDSLVPMLLQEAGNRIGVMILNGGFFRMYEVEHPDKTKRGFTTLMPTVVPFVEHIRFKDALGNPLTNISREFYENFMSQMAMANSGINGVKQ